MTPVGFLPSEVADEITRIANAIDQERTNGFEGEEGTLRKLNGEVSSDINVAYYL